MSKTDDLLRNIAVACLRKANHDPTRRLRNSSRKSVMPVVSCARSPRRLDLPNSSRSNILNAWRVI